MVERPPGHLAEWGRHLQALERVDELLGFSAFRLPGSFCDRIDRRIPDHRALPGIVVPALLVGLAELAVLGRVDLGPWVARDPPALWRLVLQRVEVLRLAGKEVE